MRVARARKTAALFLLVVSFAVPRADAAPILLTEAEFTDAIVGLTTVVEDFEGFSTDSQPNPMTLANGTFMTVEPSTGTFLCHGGGDVCLWDNSSITDPRTFSAFPTGTTLWATDVGVFEPTDTFRISVTGNSGSLVFDAVPAASFYGFSDPTGLISVSFQNLGTHFDDGSSSATNYTFDNVVTVSQTAVPEPATFSVLALGLAGLARRRRRQRTAS